MHVLLLSRFSRLGSSSRVRFLQYLPYLAAHGVRVTHSPLLDDTYLQHLYAHNHRQLAAILGTYLRRLAVLATARKYDLLWIEKECFPCLPAWLEKVPELLSIPYVVDYDDATFHSYDQHKNPLARKVLAQKIHRVMRAASVVVAGNSYIAERARTAGARRVEIIPSVVDLERYHPGGDTHSSVFTIGWIGSPVTAKHLETIKPALAEVSSTGPARLVLVGSGPVHVAGVSVEIRQWSEATEAADALSFDVGIMPLPDQPWERGKCGYKLIQYMACAKPVVASPVGANREIVQHGANGFLAGEHRDWIAALSRLRDDPVMRLQMGRHGREMVEARYALQVTAPVMLSLLREAAGSHSEYRSTELSEQ